MSSSPGLLPTSPNPTGGISGFLQAQSNPSVESPGLLPVASIATGGQVPSTPTVSSPALLPAPSKNTPGLLQTAQNPAGGQVLLSATSNPTVSSHALVPAAGNPTGETPGLLPAAPIPPGGQVYSPAQSNPTVCSPAILPAAPNPTEGDTVLLPASSKGGDSVFFPAPPNFTGDSQVLLAAQPNPTGDTKKVTNIFVGQPSQLVSQMSITAIPVDTHTASKDDPPGNTVSVHSSAVSSTIPQCPQETTEDQQQFSFLDDDPFWPGYWSASVPMSEIPSSEAPINYSLTPMDLSAKQKSVPYHAVQEQLETNVSEKSKDVKPEDETDKNEKDGSETKS